MDVSDQTTALLERVRDGDGNSVGALFELYRARLWRMVDMRLDRRLSRRLSADDVLQEAFLDVVGRIGSYLERMDVPFYVWLRFLTIQRMQMLQRAHLGARMRSVTQERPLPGEGMALASAESMAGELVGHLTSPSQAAMRHERQERLRATLDAMDPVDREVLALRHFEELSNQEVAAVLGINKDAASKRHLRALKRLKEILSDQGNADA